MRQLSANTPRQMISCSIWFRFRFHFRLGFRFRFQFKNLLSNLDPTWLEPGPRPRSHWSCVNVSRGLNWFMKLNLAPSSTDRLVARVEDGCGWMGVATVNVECFIHVTPHPPSSLSPSFCTRSASFRCCAFLLFHLIWYFRIRIFSLDSLRICACGLARATLPPCSLPAFLTPGDRELSKGPLSAFCPTPCGSVPSWPKDIQFVNALALRNMSIKLTQSSHTHMHTMHTHYAHLKYSRCSLVWIGNLKLPHAAYEQYFVIFAQSELETEFAGLMRNIYTLCLKHSEYCCI